MLENVIHFTKSHIVWTLECGCGLHKSPERGALLSGGAVLGAELTGDLRETQD